MVLRGSRRIERGLWVEYASVAWMTVECVAAIYSGIAAWSLALLAFGGDSLVELLSSFAVVQHLRSKLLNSSAHRESKRAEWATALLLASLIPVIGLAAVYSFLRGIKPESSLLGMSVAAAAVVIMPVLWYEKRRIGIASNCVPLKIDAAESATCFWMSAALLAGLAINFVWKVPWVDYGATFVILGFVAKEAIEAIREVRYGEAAAGAAGGAFASGVTVGAAGAGFLKTSRKATVSIFGRYFSISAVTVRFSTCKPSRKNASSGISTSSFPCSSLTLNFSGPTDGIRLCMRFRTLSSSISTIFSIVRS